MVDVVDLPGQRLKYEHAYEKCYQQANVKKIKDSHKNPPLKRTGRIIS